MELRMRMNLNWYQRAILIVAGLLMLLFAIDSTDSYSDADYRLATGQFVIAVILFIVAASSKKKDA
jgi:hypothetical protein